MPTTLEGFAGLLPARPDALQLYLLAINVLALGLHALNHAVAVRGGRELLRPEALASLAVAGGAAGAAVGILLWGRRTAKDNVWDRLVVAAFLVLWGVLLGFFYVRPLDAQGCLEQLRTGNHLPLAACVAAASVAAFAAFGIDKRRARRGAWRIPEAVLLGLAFAGGSPGALLGMRAFHHKVRSPEFVFGLPLIVVAQLALLAFLLNLGLV